MKKKELLCFPVRIKGRKGKEEGAEVLSDPISEE